MFEVYKSEKSEKYYFRLKAKNGQIILASQGYADKAGCLNGVESVKKNCDDDNCYDIKEQKDGQHYFNLKSTNGQIIGKSEAYKAKAGLENGIASIKKNAPDSEVKDLSA